MQCTIIHIYAFNYLAYKKIQIKLKTSIINENFSERMTKKPILKHFRCYKSKYLCNF